MYFLIYIYMCVYIYSESELQLGFFKGILDLINRRDYMKAEPLTRSLEMKIIYIYINKWIYIYIYIFVDVEHSLNG